MVEELNKEQQKAVDHVEGPLLVLAGAGSGKTRVVTKRLAHLIELGIPSSDILALTFTNKAAEEMRTRIERGKGVWVLASTFHSLGARILRESAHLLGFQSDFTIYDVEDSEKLLKASIQEIFGAQDKAFFKKMRSAISSYKNQLVDPEEADREFIDVYRLYQKNLKSCNALDFDDLIYLPCKLFQTAKEEREKYQNRWSFVLIDEYQDTNFAQYQMAKTLVEKHRNIMAVGDPDQSIYSWRGAQYQNILRFEEDFPGALVITLEQNYRSTNHILQAANALIAHNEKRLEKNLWSALGNGEKIGVYIAQNEREEADFIKEQLFSLAELCSLDEIAILYRTNAQSRPFEDALLAAHIPYRIIGGLSFYQRREIKDTLCYLKMILSDRDQIAFLRTILLPKRGIGISGAEKIVHAAKETNTPIFSFCKTLLHPNATIKLNARQKGGLQEYVETIEKLRERKKELTLHELISEMVLSTGYLDYLKIDLESYQDRKENIEELIGKAAEWQEENEEKGALEFLEELSLRSSEEGQEEGARLKMMTLHNSKGLEFETVFLVGLEEDLFPHINVKEDPEGLEEERRLCYVGMTRAKKRLFVTASSYRYMWGGARFMRPSRFFKELPHDHLKNLSPISPLAKEEGISPKSFSEFGVGDKVRHSEFGEGVIQKTYQGSFGLTYDIYFPSASTIRTLVAKFAKLHRG